MQDHAKEAEALFRTFAERHSLTIERVDEPNVELLMRVPRQSGFAFELWLGLQDGDVLNIGFERFWSHIFPFEQKRDLVASLLDGVVTGECRLAIYRQFGFVVKRVLERRTNDAWMPIYRVLGFGIPLIRTSVSYICNESASSS